MAQTLSQYIAEIRTSRDRELASKLQGLVPLLEQDIKQKQVEEEYKLQMENRVSDYSQIYGNRYGAEAGELFRSQSSGVKTLEGLNLMAKSWEQGKTEEQSRNAIIAAMEARGATPEEIDKVRNAPSQVEAEVLAGEKLNQKDYETTAMEMGIYDLYQAEIGKGKPPAQAYGDAARRYNERMSTKSYRGGGGGGGSSAVSGLGDDYSVTDGVRTQIKDAYDAKSSTVRINIGGEIYNVPATIKGEKLYLRGASGSYLIHPTNCIQEAISKDSVSRTLSAADVDKYYNGQLETGAGRTPPDPQVQAKIDGDKGYVDVPLLGKKQIDIEVDAEGDFLIKGTDYVIVNTDMIKDKSTLSKKEMKKYEEWSVSAEKIDYYVKQNPAMAAKFLRKKGSQTGWKYADSVDQNTGQVTKQLKIGGITYVPGMYLTKSVMDALSKQQ